MLERFILPISCSDSLQVDEKSDPNRRRAACSCNLIMRTARRPVLRSIMKASSDNRISGTRTQPVVPEHLDVRHTPHYATRESCCSSPACEILGPTLHVLTSQLRGFKLFIGDSFLRGALGRNQHYDALGRCYTHVLRISRDRKR